MLMMNVSGYFVFITLPEIAHLSALVLKINVVATDNFSSKRPVQVPLFTSLGSPISKHFVFAYPSECMCFEYSHM
jgi:hypothetical protein